MRPERVLADRLTAEANAVAEAIAERGDASRIETGDPTPIIREYKRVGLPNETRFGAWDRDGYSDAAHEIAHWYCAANSRKRDRHFGLGPPGAIHLGRLSPDGAVREEMRASLLGILIERSCGRCWQWTWNAHDWWDAPRAAVVTHLGWLRRNGLIDGGGVPQLEWVG